MDAERRGQNQQPSRSQVAVHISHRRGVGLNVFDDADAGDGVKLALQAARTDDVDIENLPVPVGHAPRPVVADVVNRRDDEAAVSEHVRPRVAR